MKLLGSDRIFLFFIVLILFLASTGHIAESIVIAGLYIYFGSPKKQGVMSPELEITDVEPMPEFVEKLRPMEDVRNSPPHPPVYTDALQLSNKTIFDRTFLPTKKHYKPDKASQLERARKVAEDRSAFHKAMLFGKNTTTDNARSEAYNIVDYLAYEHDPNDMTSR